MTFVASALFQLVHHRSGTCKCLKDFDDKPTLLIKLAAREQELNFGSAPFNSATTKAREARAA